MSPHLEEKANELIDAMFFSTEDIGWDCKQQLMVNRRGYQDTDIVRLIPYVILSLCSLLIQFPQLQLD